ncbi:IS200/IS605 family OrfB protein [Sulfolobus islandicus HVE10/4]|uniref:IS200/IS605 family OrfB protein n=1 Tax=Saccharolobus islandicus (strain HVE10/4) TaxID=930943 RepID=F0NN43_SACI0|nr:IS200/IS605 family OrfB protein [Sulfolobus islandicus HVE10/4]
MYFLLVISQVMTGTAHEGGSDKSVDGRVVVFPSTSPNDLRVTVYDPLGGVPHGGIRSN